MTKDIRPALRAFLLADAGISTAVGGTRIFPHHLPQGERQTSIVYNRASGFGDYHMEGPSGLASPRWQIDAWAQDPDTATALSNLVKSRINGFRGTMGAGATEIIVQGVFQEDEDQDHDAEAGLYRDRRDYRIVFDEL